MSETRRRKFDRRPLHERLAGRLREEIINGDLGAGDKINEAALCAAYNVSRTPLRESLKLLAQEGLVTLTPHRGASVARLTLDDLEEAFPVMGALEGLAGELACRNITAGEQAHIKGLHAMMAASHRMGDTKPYFSLNREIHEAILAAARNPTLSQMARSLDGRVRRARYQAAMSSERWARAVAEHEEMMVALYNRDGPRLAEIMRRHLEGKLATVREALRAEGR